MGKIQIHQLLAETTLGIHNWERKIITKIMVDLEIFLNVTNAALSDDLEQTIDYEHLIQNLKLWFKQQKFRLLETLCQQTTYYLFTNYPIIEVLSVTIVKPGVMDGVMSIGVTVTRNRSDFKNFSL